MASTIEQIDAYLKKNKKPLFSNLNNWYGKNDSDANNLKFLWNAAQDARGINNKIEAFKTLQEELAHWTDLEELERQEAELADAGADNWTDPQAKVEMDKMRFFGQLSNTPSIDKLTDLSIDDVYDQGYDTEQMKALARDYGYDYTDKNERAEFLKKVSAYQQAKDIEKIWNDDIYAGMVTPIAKEYAKQNYQNIDGFSDIAGPLIADVGVNTLMAGPSKSAIINNTVAPITKAGLNMAINNESLEDAAKDAANEVATNFAFRFGIRGANRYANELFNKGGKQTVQGRVNQMANEARARKDIHVKQPKIIETSKGVGKEDGYEYFVYDKDGVLQPSTYKEWVNDPDRVTLADGQSYNFEKEKKSLFTNWRDRKKEAMPPKAKEGIVWSMEREGIEPEKMAYYQAEAMDTPRETFWNFAKNNAVSQDMRNYLNNLQGRTKWGGAALGALANYDPTHTISQKTFEKKPKLTKADKAELEMLRRLYELNAKYPNMVSKPKLPEKYKEYGITLDDIFKSNNP